MKTGRLNLRLSENRLKKLRLYAQSKEKTITQLIEDWIDRLPSQKVGDSDAGVPEGATLTSTHRPVNPTD